MVPGPWSREKKNMLRRGKPRTPGQRHRVRRKVETEGGRKKVPVARRAAKKQTGGRNHSGRITVHQRGGGVKRRRRKRVNGGRERGVGQVRGIQYDPNRTGRVARRSDLGRGGAEHSRDPRATQGPTAYKYVLAVKGLAVGDVIQYGDGGVEERKRGGEVKAQRRGSTKKLKHMEVGATICNREMVPGRGAQVARAAGQSGRIRRKERGEEGSARGGALIRLKGGKTVWVDRECTATYGRVSAEEHARTKRGKAGRTRRRGWRPKVRGEAMNPVDHPHGGRTRGGRPERTPWGRLAKGQPTVTKNQKKKGPWQRRRG